MCREDIFIPGVLGVNAVQVMLVCSQNLLSNNDVKYIKPCAQLPPLQCFGLNSESNLVIAALTREPSYVTANKRHLTYRAIS